MNNIETKLFVEIDDELDALNKIELGSEKYKIAVDGVTKLMDRAIEIDKLDIEREERSKSQEEERRDRTVRNCLTAAGIIIPTIVTIWGTIKSFEFEREGTITTIMGRGFVQKLLPKK